MNEKAGRSRSLCCGCLSRYVLVDHVCSSQMFSDSMYSLSELANVELSLLKDFSLDRIEVQGEEELRQWHQSAREHLQIIFEERQEELKRIFEKDLLVKLEESRERILRQLKDEHFPLIHQFIEQRSTDTNKIQFIQNYLSILKHDGERLASRCWLTIHLPDLKNFSIPIRIAKMPLAATLNEEHLNDEQEEDEDDQDEEEKKKDEKEKEEFDLLKIFTLTNPPKKVFPLEGNSSTLAFSSTHLLLHDQKKLLLFNLNQKINELSWNDNDAGILVDMCWMSSIRSFVILTIHSVYLFDPWKESLLKIDSIRPLDRSHVLSSLSSRDRDLFINYHKGIHLDQYRFVEQTSEWILHKRFDKEELIENKDLGVRDVRSNGDYLCLSLMQEEDLRWRLDLFSREMVRVRRGVPMDAGENQQKFFSMLIPFNAQQAFLFLNWFTNQLWIVDRQGKTRQIKENKIKNIRNIAISTDSTYLAIRTEKPSLLQLFQLQ